MAKKSDGKGRAGSPLPAESGNGTAAGAHGVTRPAKLKSSALLDTRIVYCGDNLEQPEQTRLPILHSSFVILNLPMPASHYVKVMLDQIFGENNFSNAGCIA